MSRGMLSITAWLVLRSTLTARSVSVRACVRSCPESTPVRRNVTRSWVGDGSAVGGGSKPWSSDDDGPELEPGSGDPPGGGDAVADGASAWKIWLPAS